MCKFYLNVLTVFCDWSVSKDGTYALKCDIVHINIQSKKINKR